MGNGLQLGMIISDTCDVHDRTRPCVQNIILMHSSKNKINDTSVTHTTVTHILYMLMYVRVCTYPYVPFNNVTVLQVA